MYRLTRPAVRWRPVTVASITARGIHSSPVALKKEKKSNAVIDDLFSASAAEDLFSESTTPSSTSSSTSDITSTQTPSANLVPTKKLSPAARQDRFTSLLHKTVEPHLNPPQPPPRNPASPHLVDQTKEKIYHDEKRIYRRLKPFRKTVWTHLVQLAQTREELEMVMDRCAKWKDLQSRGKTTKNKETTFTEIFGEELVTHSTRVGAPDIALNVFTHHSKYGVPLSIHAARALLHALLHAEKNVEDVLVVIRLYELYGLKPIEKDLTGLSMVLAKVVGSAYGARQSDADKTSPTLTGFIPTILTSLRPLITDANVPIRVPRTGHDKARITVHPDGTRTVHREELWAKRSLDKAYTALKRNRQSDVEWLKV